jgi:ribonuclease Y
MMNYIFSSGLVFLGLCIIGGLFYKKKSINKEIGKLNNLEDEIQKSRLKAREIMDKAESDAHARSREVELRTKDELLRMKEEADKEIKNFKNELQQRETRLVRKEEALDTKIEKIEERNHEIDRTTELLEKKKEEIEQIRLRQETELERISGMSKTEAKEILITKLKEDLVHDTAITIKDFENNLEMEKDRISKRILSTAIGKAASEYVVDATVSVVNLPNDEMKGRIIGREGRNIRTIEALTGVDIIIDDTPEAVVLSSFDGVKREVARIAIERLITDGRIHPGKIEEIVNKAQKEIDKEIINAGEEAVLEVGITGVHPEIIKHLGKLKYRTSYGQNVLMHSIEVAKLASTLASELKGDVKLAKRAGLLHDIGKILDSDIEYSHALIGGEFLKKFGEKPEVINAVMAHHNEVEFESIESILVQAADAVSASRPGARRETLTAYLKRLKDLEEIANSFTGVESSYAIQAGREIRIVINPDEVSDDAATKMARDVAKKVEETMQYPGQIKVTVLRETRAIDYAR